MILLFIIKWSFYFFVAFFAIGIAMMLLEAALTIILVVTAPFLFVGGLVLSVITAPLTLLLRSLGINAPYFGKWFFDKIFYVLDGKAARNRQQEQSEYYQRSEYTQRPPPRDEDRSPGDDPWELLGLERGASKKDIIVAYRKKMMANHPDKVATLDPELQKFATRRTAKLTQAYEVLLASV